MHWTHRPASLAHFAADDVEIMGVVEVDKPLAVGERPPLDMFMCRAVDDATVAATQPSTIPDGLSLIQGGYPGGSSRGYQQRMGERLPMPSGQRVALPLQLAAQ